ncbi:PRKCA-binding protein isoform X1 [Ooceraea biroi]|uniref:PRKCA-binding protein isoform X1 n=1 Tax=Ooceraea biroi TaxID=2015173 RepID=UPI0005BD92A6|nr:PRKCA-binding protein isoform X1 [Ooceraea biroi]XP_011335600.1 PRKCA-binding protein isoform X1 [Ooceraea biroi]
MTGLGMDFEDDFFFEEDKILTRAGDATLTSAKGGTPGDSCGPTTDKASIALTTVPSASVELHQLAMMEDRIPDIELVMQDQCTQQRLTNQMGMTITSGNVMIQKDASNLIGISIGGGAPLCPCLYIVQIFDNTPVALDGTLQAGDELVAVNGASVRGKTKVEVAKMIQSCNSQVSINYNKLHADPKQGRTLDIALKKVKHRLVEGMGSTTADALGLSRAILCNDALVQRLMALKRTENFYRGLVAHAKATLHAFFDLTQIYKVFGDAFAAIGVREPQPRASEAFRQFGEQHRQMEKFGVTMLKTLKPILNDLGTYLNKAIPDTRLTISKYADAKFEYLSYCLKVKELDDEEQSCAALQEPLYRVETGNYEYRLVLRCRQEARARFAKLRSDVLVKLELLDNKHVQDVVWQLHKFAAGLAKYYASTRDLLSVVTLFPVEVDLSHSAFQYKSTGPQTFADASDDIEEYEPEEKQQNVNEELLIDTSNFPPETTDNT